MNALLALVLLMRVVLPNDFEPRAYQVRPMAFFDQGGKRAITVWHRRAGKDLTAIHQTVKSAHRDRGMYWHFFPTFEQARRSIWEGYRKDGQRILENAFPGFLSPKRAGSIVARTNESQMFVELKCGSIWRLMGTDRVESVGAGPKGVVFSEFALCRPTSWDLVRPMLRESGGWAWFITTPRGNNHAKKLYDAAGPASGWYRDLRTVHDTGLTFASNRGDRQLTAAQMMDEERAEGMEEALIRQEYLCDWSAARVGSVWGDLLEALEKRGGIGPFEHERDFIHTAWDLGKTDGTAIWFFRLARDGGLDFVDHHEAHGKDLRYYFDVLAQKAKDHGYRYARHWLPHDAAHDTLAAGTSILNRFLERYSESMVAIGPKLSLLDGIQAGRWLLQQPTRFHTRCLEGVEALKAYRYGFDEDRKAFSRTPVHDWASDSADGFRYAAVVAKAVEELQRPPEPATPPLLDPQKLCLDDLWDTAPKMGRGRA